VFAALVVASAAKLLKKIHFSGGGTESARRY
jgi:hypothetical protein